MNRDCKRLMRNLFLMRNLLTSEHTSAQSTQSSLQVLGNPKLFRSWCFTDAFLINDNGKSVQIDMRNFMPNTSRYKVRRLIKMEEKL